MDQDTVNHVIIMYWLISANVSAFLKYTQISVFCCACFVTISGRTLLLMDTVRSGQSGLLSASTVYGLVQRCNTDLSKHSVCENANMYQINSETNVRLVNVPFYLVPKCCLSESTHTANTLMTKTLLRSVENKGVSIYSECMS